MLYEYNATSLNLQISLHCSQRVEGLKRLRVHWPFLILPVINAAEAYQFEFSSKMESLSCGFEGRSLLFADDTEFVIDGLTRIRNLSKKWDGEDAVKNIGFIEPLLPDSINSSFLGDQCLESNDDTKDHSPSPVSIANDGKFAAGNLFSAGNVVFPSPEPSISAKRAKIGDSQSPVPTCQVHGCNKDLSSSKDYHKRHKVCDVHSKTAVVIVNGIRQRFCQQCSRFHILAEFDEGKRSCRKRLAGHNERRRKPQFNTYLGSSYFTTAASKSLFFSTNDLILEEELLRFHGLGKQYPSKNCLNAPFYDPGFALSLLSARKQNSAAAGAGMPIDQHAIHFTPPNSGSSDSNARATAAPSDIPQGTTTVNLLELSLHLHRVEHQKFYGQIKKENDRFFDSTVV